MTIHYNTQGVEPSGGFMPIPKGNYVLKIIKAVEGRSKSGGDPQVVVDFEVDEGKYLGHKIRFHKVTFINPEREGAGIAIHFLKTIEEPWQGAIQFEAENWVGKRLRALVDVQWDSMDRPWNAVKAVMPLDYVPVEQGAPTNPEEGIPF